MMTIFSRLTLIIVLFFSFACATQRYGRMQHVTEAEGEYLTCESIEIELDKTFEFLKAVSDADYEFTGKDVLSFLGDLGLGDSWEMKDAIQSGIARFSELKTLRKEKACKTL